MLNPKTHPANYCLWIVAFSLVGGCNSPRNGRPPSLTIPEVEFPEYEALAGERGQFDTALSELSDRRARALSLAIELTDGDTTRVDWSKMGTILGFDSTWLKSHFSIVMQALPIDEWRAPEKTEIISTAEGDTVFLQYASRKRIVSVCGLAENGLVCGFDTKTNREIVARLSALQAAEETLARMYSGKLTEEDLAWPLRLSGRAHF